MSTKARKPYVVRGFNVTDEASFDSVGTMDKFVTFAEKSVDKQHEAVVEMTCHSEFHTMSARNMVITHPNDFPYPPNDVKEVSVIDLLVVTTAQSATDLRSHRSAVRDTLKLWAEKSRVKGRRGWRCNAIKTPTFEFDRTKGGVVIKTQVILSNLVVYSDDLCTINVNHDYAMEQEDLKNLSKFLERALAGYYSRLCYRHSEIGDGEVI